MHPEAERLAIGFTRHFWASDHEIRWTELEHEHSLWLSPNTVLVGKIDAKGLTLDGDKFFADWKTASKRKARYMDAEKSQWRMSPQALTYGVLCGSDYRRFMVRWALKTDPVTCDFEWYTYSTEEVEWWKGQLLETADRIRDLRKTEGNWPLNLNNCTKYGEAYACPFRNDGCWKRDFSATPDGMQPRSQSHLAIENEIKNSATASITPVTDLVVLDASRMGDWQSCNEMYRKLWEGGGLNESSEALTIGSDFHTLINDHLTIIKFEQEAEANGGTREV